jgi:hypothetical protein
MISYTVKQINFDRNSLKEILTFKVLLEQSGSDNCLLVEMNFDDNKVLKLQLVLLIFVLMCRIIS